MRRPAPTPAPRLLPVAGPLLGEPPVASALAPASRFASNAPSYRGLSPSREPLDFRSALATPALRARNLSPDFTSPAGAVTVISCHRLSSSRLGKTSPGMLPAWEVLQRACYVNAGKDSVSTTYLPKQTPPAPQPEHPSHGRPHPHPGPLAHGRPHVPAPFTSDPPKSWSRSTPPWGLLYVCSPHPGPSTTGGTHTLSPSRPLPYSVPLRDPSVLTVLHTQPGPFARPLKLVAAMWLTSIINSRNI